MCRRVMSHRIRLPAALPALLGVVLLLLASWGFGGGAAEMPGASMHQAEHHVPKGHHDIAHDAACALMCLAQRPVGAGPEGYRVLARGAEGPWSQMRLPLVGRTPAPPWHPPEIV